MRLIFSNCFLLSHERLLLLPLLQLLCECMWYVYGVHVCAYGVHVYVICVWCVCVYVCDMCMVYVCVGCVCVICV